MMGQYLWIGGVPEGTYSARLVRRASKQALHVGGIYWLTQILPRHFSPRNVRYPMKARQAGYLERKRVQAKRNQWPFGGTVNLVRTGNMMRLMLARGEAQAFPTRLTLRLPTVKTRRLMKRVKRVNGVSQVVEVEQRYPTQKPVNMDRPHMAMEIFAQTPEEAQYLARLMAFELARELRRGEGKYIYMGKGKAMHR